jgi:hypothetical protein
VEEMRMRRVSGQAAVSVTNWGLKITSMAFFECSNQIGKHISPLIFYKDDKERADVEGDDMRDVDKEGNRLLLARRSQGYVD